jgi:hypothetical protein
VANIAPNLYRFYAEYARPLLEKYTQEYTQEARQKELA